jgi:hypothetical protein
MTQRPASPASEKERGPASAPSPAGARTATPPPQESRSGAITPRSVLIGLLLIPANAWWLIEIEYVRYSDNATTSALFFNAISLLLLLLAANLLLQRMAPRFELQSGELVVIYVMVVVATNLAGHDQLQILFTTITYVVRRSTPGSPWEQRLMPHIPEHLVVTDRTAVDDIYYGVSTLYRWDHVRAWIGPIAWWTLLVLLVVWVMLCMSALLRRQWEMERLTYPIADVPFQIIQQRQTFFGNPQVWIGFGLGAAVEVMNLLHTLWPAIPGIPIGVQYYQAADYPWRAAGSIPISSFPFAYGLSFLLPLQIGFSCWFFFLATRVELVIAAMYGHTDWNGFPYVRQQGVGAALGFGLVVLWLARGQLSLAWRAAITGAKADDSGEPMSYRVAMLGLLAGCGGLLLFAMNAGMSLLTAAYYFAILLLIVLVVARLRAEVGLPTFEFYQVGADEVLQKLAGTRSWSTGDLTAMSLFFWLSRTHRQFPMQAHVDSFRLGRRTDVPLRGLTGVILLASAVGTIAAFWALLHVTYQVGYESAKFRSPAVWAFGQDPWRKLDTWLQSPQPADPSAVGAYLFGMAMVGFLALMRTRFVGWPFHPAGYLVAGSFGLMRLWLPIFLAWAVKALILRYGGLQGYRAALPFFIGLVLGEFAAGFVRTVLDGVFKLYLPPASGIGGL